MDAGGGALAVLCALLLGVVFIWLFAIGAWLALDALAVAPPRAAPLPPSAPSPLRGGAGAIVPPGMFAVVRRGVFSQNAIEKLCASGQLSTCFGQNPASPYLSPSWDDAAPPATTNVVATDGYLLGDFELGPTDVFVLAGRTPPPCVYFGYTPYVYTVPGCFDRNGDPLAVFGSAADTTNGAAFGDERSRFNRAFALIYSANLAAGNAMAEALRASSPAGTVVIFSPIKRRPEGTRYIVAGRIAHPEDEAELARYLASPAGAVRIARGAPARFAAGPFQTTSIWKPVATEGNENVAPGANALQRAAMRARDVLSAVGVTDWVELPPPVVAPFPGYTNGDDCVDGCRQCFGDNRDALYMAKLFPDFGENEVILIVGANHVLYGKATYTSFAVYDVKSNLGLFSVDVTDRRPRWTSIIITRDAALAPAPVQGESQHLFVVPPDVRSIGVVERTYVQPRGANNIMPDPSTILPFIVYRGRLEKNY